MTISALNSTRRETGRTSTSMSVPLARLIDAQARGNRTIVSCASCAGSCAVIFFQRVRRRCNLQIAARRTASKSCNDTNLPPVAAKGTNKSRFVAMRLPAIRAIQRPKEKCWQRQHNAPRKHSSPRVVRCGLRRIACSRLARSCQATVLLSVCPCVGQLTMHRGTDSMTLDFRLCRALHSLQASRLNDSDVPAQVSA